MVDCIFCKISKKELPAPVIYEDEFSLAFLDIHPHAPGHTMVIPKSHFENLSDFPQKGIGPFFSAVKNVAALLKKKLKPDGFTIGINHGQVSGQAVPHLHVHIMPRFAGDAGSSIHGVVNNPPKESLAEIQKKVLS